MSGYFALFTMDNYVYSLDYKHFKNKHFHSKISEYNKTFVLVYITVP